MPTGRIKMILNIIARKGSELHCKAFGNSGGFPGILGMITGRYQTSADAGFGGVGSGGFNFLDAAAGSANGNVFYGPGISTYSNKIVDRPTFFARGGNVMGEAGPEAIMPLTRINGKLGVQATTSGGNNGGGGTQVIINNYSGADVEEKRSSGPGGVDIVEVMIGKVGERIARGDFDKAMRSRFGAVPASQRR